MCSAPNVYMFVYILIGSHMVPIKIIHISKLSKETLKSGINIEFNNVLELNKWQKDKYTFSPYLCVTFLLLVLQ